MSRLTRFFSSQRTGTTKFTGDWDYRLSGLFECGVEFGSKTVLDAGCHMGIVAYEISKQRPALIHGVDHYGAAIKVAGHIFSAVPVPSAFYRANLISERSVNKVLLPRYDIVVFMSVWQHIRNRYGGEIGDRVAMGLAHRCSSVFLARVPHSLHDHFSEIMEGAGFQVMSRWISPTDSDKRHLVAYRRGR
jgi:2-polyprenyl-3-methyl-5-hydroxy-6-metoxy-1,4-benzoquinol methylase